MASQVRNVILRALQQSQLDKAAAAGKLPDAAAAAAQAAVERVFEQCLQVCLYPLSKPGHWLCGTHPFASHGSHHILHCSCFTQLLGYFSTVGALCLPRPCRLCSCKTLQLRWVGIVHG